MTGWIIFGSILLILIIALAQSVKVTAVYDGKPEITVKLLFFTLYKTPLDPKTVAKKKRKKAKKEAREKKKQEKLRKKAEKKAAKNGAPAEPAEAGSPDSSEASEEADGKAKKPKKAKKKLNLNFQMIMDYVCSAAPPIKRLFKKIRIRDLYIDWVVGSDDAAKTALKYGGICSAIYPLLEWMKLFFDTKVNEVNIEADFSAEKDDIFLYMTMKLRISTALACVIWLGWRVLKTYLRYNSKPKQHKGAFKKARPAASR